MPIALEAPDQPEVRRLIEALDDYQAGLYPPESHHRTDLATLGQPHVLFAVARPEGGGPALGCAAVMLGPEHGELKRMYVQPARRGSGLGAALLQFLEAQARQRGCTLLLLETGPLQPEAIALYARLGFVRRGPFGGYRDDPLSVFMAKPLTAAAPGPGHAPGPGDTPGPTPAQNR